MTTGKHGKPHGMPRLQQGVENEQASNAPRVDRVGNGRNSYWSAIGKLAGCLLGSGFYVCGLGLECMGGQLKQPDPIWRVKVDHTRTESMRVIRNIRQGLVNEDDVDMLQNFVLFALALMQAEGPKKWELAKMNAEIMALQPGVKNAANRT
jgi:hypothetical protein